MTSRLGTGKPLTFFTVYDAEETLTRSVELSKILGGKINETITKIFIFKLVRSVLEEQLPKKINDSK